MTKCKRQAAARLVLTAVSLAGLALVVKAALDPDLEARMFPIIALAFALGPLSADLGGTPQSPRMHLPLMHCVLFASVLVIGPYGAALPGAASGVARLLSGRSPDRPLYQVMHAVLRPAAVCAAAALAYTAAGGDPFYPQSLDSTLAVVCAAVAYIAANAIAAGIVGELAGENRTDGTDGTNGTNALFAVVAAWLICLTGGYLLAVLCSVTPLYVLCVPALAAAVAYVALREPVERPDEPSIESEESSETDSGLYVDAATGLASRRYLEMFLASEASRAQRSGKPLSAAIFDLDNLQNLAENGREATDAAVRILADAIKSGLRDYDLVARYSAGRLVVVLPEADTETALEIAERLHEAAASLHYANEPLRATVGIATLPDNASTAEELIRAAHHALNRGRFAKSNQVHSLDDLAKAS